jgi:ABC-type sugar transport system ATPase subunit
MTMTAAQVRIGAGGPGPEVTPTATLTVEGLRKAFGAVRALEGTGLRADAGQIHALLGENGAGKSTLMRILSGVCPADAGTVSLDGRPLTLGRPAAAARAGIRTVFQELSTIGHLTVAENLLYGREPTMLGLVRRLRVRADAVALLERFGLGRIDPDALVSELALGDRQLLEVVKALRERPRVLILDEATSALSATDSAWVLDHGRRAARDGAVVLLITHRLAEVRQVADRLTVLRGGVDVLSGAPGDFDDDALITAMLGRRVERLYPQRAPAGDRVALRVDGLRAGRTGPLDLQVREGEILGLGGLQGQGQREVLQALAGALPWTAGEASLGDAPFRPGSPGQALRRRVAFVPEDRQREGLFLAHSVATNITAAALARFARHHVLDRRAEARGAADGATRVGVDRARLPARVTTLSGGNQQKVVLAKALVDEPDVLLLHDCTRGVDVGTKAEIFALMAQLAAAGTAIVFYSSDLSELVHMCDRVVVMVEGMARGVLERSELSEGAILRLAVGQADHRDTPGEAIA